MMFCPKCGSLLKPTKVDGKNILACHCGHESSKEFKIGVALNKEKEVAIVHKEEQTDPLTDVECPKCGHGKAHFWTIQTRAGDEPETKFLRCEKCKHTWRDYN